MIKFESERIKKLGTYIFQAINDKKAQARKEGKDIIDLGMGNPDLKPPQPVIDKLIEVVNSPKVHRYSASRGIKKLREEICKWYDRKYNVHLNSEDEAVVCIGSKEGINHLALAFFDKNDTVLIPNPTYPSHFYAVLISGANVFEMPLNEENSFIPDLGKIFVSSISNPTALILSYPNNPTTQVVEMDFFKEVVKFAKKHNIIVIHDFAYAEICFDGYKAPSFLQVDGAKDVGIEFYSLSKTYSMAGWRMGFAVGKKEIIGSLVKLKSYYDYGIWTPIQVASISALKLEDKYAVQTAEVYRKRRDTFIDGLNRIGWHTEKPKATMYVWAKIPERFREMGSMDFAMKMLQECEVAVSPGIGFGKYGEGYIRIALVENEQRLKQAVRNIKKLFKS